MVQRTDLLAGSTQRVFIDIDSLLRPVYGAEIYGKQALTFADPVTLTCVVQPAGGDDLELLPEGQRLNNVQAIWSTVPLYVANGKDRDSDVLEVDSVRFTVIKLFNRAPNGYYKVLAEGFVHTPVGSHG